MNFMSRLRVSSTAFTLVELLVTVSIIAILISLLLPSLGAARRSAQAMSSAVSLNAMGRSFLLHTEEDSDARFCTGSFDYIRDGDIRKVGWVNDLVEMAVVNPGRALDPSNPARVSKTVAEYTGMLTDDFGNVEPGSYWTDQAEALTSVLSESEAKAAIEEGYNTNYVASWHLVRGDPVNVNLSSFKNSSDISAGTPNDGIGPITMDDLANARTNIHNIPMLSEARVMTSSSQAVDPAWLGSGSTINVGMKSIGVDRASEGLAEVITGGMNAYNGTGAHPGLQSDRGNGSAANANEAWQHEFANFWPKHFGKRVDQQLLDETVLRSWLVGGFANVLFSDGHVAKVKDLNGIDGRPDGFLGAYPTGFANGTFGGFIAGGENTLWGENVLSDSKGN